MASSRRPSFLKRQKEQARQARATEKREARRARKHAKANRPEGMDPDMLENDLAEGEAPDDVNGVEDQDDDAGDGGEPDETPH